jgi:hypothetical protein
LPGTKEEYFQRLKKTSRVNLAPATSTWSITTPFRKKNTFKKQLKHELDLIKNIILETHKESQIAISIFGKKIQKHLGSSSKPPL